MDTGDPAGSRARDHPVEGLHSHPGGQEAGAEVESTGRLSNFPQKKPRCQALSTQPGPVPPAGLSPLPTPLGLVVSAPGRPLCRDKPVSLPPLLGTLLSWHPGLGLSQEAERVLEGRAAGQTASPTSPQISRIATRAGAFPSAPGPIASCSTASRPAWPGQRCSGRQALLQGACV